eukprot:SAG31_NODE_17291_length_676_cov_1.365685_2_plen_33_part_01
MQRALRNAADSKSHLVGYSFDDSVADSMADSLA